MKKQEPARSRQKTNVTGSAHPASQNFRHYGPAVSETHALDRTRATVGTVGRTTMSIKNTGSGPAEPNVPVISSHTKDVASLREAKRLPPSVRSTAGEGSKRHGRDVSEPWHDDSAPSPKRRSASASTGEYGGELNVPTAKKEGKIL